VAHVHSKRARTLGVGGAIISVAVVAGLLGRTRTVRVVVWRFSIRDQFAPSALTSTREAVFAGTFSGKLVAVDAALGRLRWQIELPLGPAIFSACNASGDTVYFAGPGGVAAVDTAAGKPIWTSTRAGTTGCAIAEGGAEIYVSGPTLDALDARTGRKLWSFALPPGTVSRAAPSNTEVYVTTGRPGGAVCSITAHSGVESWRSQETKFKWPILRASHEIVVVEGKDSNMYGLDVKNGGVVWAYRSPSVADRWLSSGRDNAFYVTQYDGRVARHRCADGACIWSRKLSAPMTGPVTVSGRRVYAAGGIGRVFAIASSDGRIEADATVSSLRERMSPDNLLAAACTSQPEMASPAGMFVSTSYGCIYRIRTDL